MRTALILIAWAIQFSATVTWYWLVTRQFRSPHTR